MLVIAVLIELVRRSEAAPAMYYACKEICHAGACTRNEWWLQQCSSSPRYQGVAFYCSHSPNSSRSALLGFFCLFSS